MARKSDPTTIDDIPVVFTCPQCGEQVEEKLRVFNIKHEFVCRIGAHAFTLTQETRDDIFRQHSERIGEIFGR